MAFFRPMNIIPEGDGRVENSDTASGALAAVARFKRTNRFAGLARALLSVRTDKLWREEGYTSFEDRGRKAL